ncbi:hypothetical protein ACNQ2A_03260 [Mycoplasma sp. 1458C]|uniref:hypothetical protein n=1 Tax=Mycoplasma sp. 1458C TaxID=3401661 RepID=UPI003AAA5D46
MKLKGILLTISGLPLVATPVLAASCYQPSQQQGINPETPGTDFQLDEKIKTKLNKTINSIKNLDIKDKARYTVDQLVAMDKAELASLITIADDNFNPEDFNIIVVNAEKKLNDDGIAYDLDLTIQLVDKAKNDVTSFTRKFKGLSGFNISDADLKALIASKYINAFAKKITLDVASKAEMLAKDVTKEQIAINIDPEAPQKDLFNVEIISFRPKAVSTTLEVTLLISAKNSSAKETILLDIEGFKNEENELNNAALKEALTANMKDIKLTVKNNKLVPSQVTRNDIAASNYDEKNFTFSILDDVTQQEGNIIKVVEPALQPQFKLDSSKYAKLGLKIKFKLTAKTNSEISQTGEFEIKSGFPNITASIFSTPLAKTVVEEPAQSAGSRDVKYLQLQYRKKTEDKKYTTATAFVKKDLDPIDENDPHKDLKYKYKELRQKILDNLFVKSNDGSGSLMIIPNLPTTQRTFLATILFSIDRQYYASKPKSEPYQLFNAPKGKELFAIYLTYNVENMIDIAKKTATNANV